MKIGELARLAGCPVETVRYYEREQLLPAAIRDQNNNYRHYDKRHLEQLVFIRRCRSLEMTHDEIRELLAARSQPDAGCSAIDGLIQAHLEHVRTRMVELQALEAELNDLRGSRPRRTAVMSPAACTAATSAVASSRPQRARRRQCRGLGVRQTLSFLLLIGAYDDEKKA